MNDGKSHLLLAASGSVATIKLPSIISAFELHSNLSIRIILTSSAARFLAGQSPEQPTIASLASLPNVDGIYFDEDEWEHEWTRGAEILHIELRRWANLLAIVPLSANTLAKIANGLSDNLLTSVIRAWDAGSGKMILVAPSMNTHMWTNPVTAEHLEKLQKWSWFEVLLPQVKTLACGDVGQGGMQEWTDVVGDIESRLGFSAYEQSKWL